MNFLVENFMSSWIFQPKIHANMKIKFMSWKKFITWNCKCTTSLSANCDIRIWNSSIWVIQKFLTQTSHLSTHCSSLKVRIRKIFQEKSETAMITPSLTDSKYAPTWYTWQLTYKSLNCIIGTGISWRLRDIIFG